MEEMLEQQRREQVCKMLSSFHHSIRLTQSPFPSSLLEAEVDLYSSKSAGHSKLIENLRDAIFLFV